MKKILARSDRVRTELIFCISYDVFFSFSWSSFNNMGPPSKRSFLCTKTEKETFTHQHLAFAFSGIL